jgi:hypothetical protein
MTKKQNTLLKGSLLGFCACYLANSAECGGVFGHIREFGGQVLTPVTNDVRKLWRSSGLVDVINGGKNKIVIEEHHFLREWNSAPPEIRVGLTVCALALGTYYAVRGGQRLYQWYYGQDEHGTDQQDVDTTKSWWSRLRGG